MKDRKENSTNAINEKASEFKILLPQVSDRTLAKQLKELQLDGLIQKDRSKTASIYSLTDKSRKLKPLLAALSGFNND